MKVLPPCGSASASHCLSGGPLCWVCSQQACSPWPTHTRVLDLHRRPLPMVASVNWLLLRYKTMTGLQLLPLLLAERDAAESLGERLGCWRRSPYPNPHFGSTHELGFRSLVFYISMPHGWRQIVDGGFPQLNFYGFVTGNSSPRACLETTYWDDRTY